MIRASVVFQAHLTSPATGKTRTVEVGIAARKGDGTLARPLKKKRRQTRRGKYDITFPLPQDVQNFAKTKEDQVNFQTNLSLQDIAQFYRREFTAQGLVEIAPVAVIANDCISLAFAGLLHDEKVIVQAVDLGYMLKAGMRNVNVRTEVDRKDSEEDLHALCTVNVGAIEIVLGMTGLALEKAGYSDAADLVKENFIAKCTVCGVTISGADIMSEQRQLFRQWGKEAVVLYRGPDALAWENLDEKKCVRPGCSSTTYQLSWTDSATRHIFDSVLSRFEQS